MKKKAEQLEDYVPENMRDYFYGELSMLILDKSYRGRVIGKKKLLEIFELAKVSHTEIARIESSIKRLNKFQIVGFIIQVISFIGCFF